MDEPTNHLDLARIGLLERWIATLPRDLPMLIASHDRAFLDAVTNRTLFLRTERSRLFPLPFSPARIAMDEADAADGRQFDNDMKKAAQLRRQAAKLKNIGINSGSDLLITKTKQLKDRAAKLEDAARPAHAERSAGAIRLMNSGTHAKALIAFEDAEIATPEGRVLFRTGQVWINRGDRIVLLGRNGTGKTRLMTRLAEALAGAEDAAIRVTPSVVPGISDQGLTQLDRFKTPMQAITHQFDLGDQRARGVLAGAGMVIDRQDGPVKALSGGQKARLAMLILRLSQPNFYLLDEPTNHLDIEGQEALETELVGP
jgi:ATPase subunit of ABC transporter with duplicated ATPase domains